MEFGKKEGIPGEIKLMSRNKGGKMQGSPSNVTKKFYNAMSYNYSLLFWFVNAEPVDTILVF